MKRNRTTAFMSMLFAFLLVLNVFTPQVSAMTLNQDNNMSIELNEKANESLTVLQARALNNDKSISTVKGYVVGYGIGKNVIVDSFPEDHNLVIADVAGETDTSKMLVIQLTAAYRAEFGLKTNPDNMGTQVVVTGTLEKYVGDFGLKNPSSMEFFDSSLSVAQARALNNDKSISTVKGFVVGYGVGKNVIIDSFPEDHNLVIADKVGETDTNKMLVIQLTAAYRAKFGLKTNPKNLGTEIVVTGTLEKYVGDFGLKNPTNIEFKNAIPEIPVEAELITIATARSQKKGLVRVKGFVTAKLKNSIQVQDATGAIAVRPTSLDINLGEEVTLQGELMEYRALLQLDSARIIEKSGKNQVIEAVELKASELKDNQSELAKVLNIKITDITDGGAWANYHAEDAEGTKFLVRDENNSLPITVGSTYDSITGIISQFDEDIQFIPRNVSDIVFDSTVAQPVYATPGEGMVPSGTEVELKSYTEGAEIFFTLDNSDPLVKGIKYDKAIILDKDSTLRVIAKKTGLKTSTETVLTYKVYDASEGIKIHHIQGESHESPMKGQLVQDIEGVVTYKFDIRGSHYFNIQALEKDYDGNPKTSEAIVIYTGKAVNVEIGDLVNVNGKVDEYQIDGYDDRVKTDLPLTQINARDDQGGIIKVLEKKVTLPKAIKITSSDIPKVIAGDKTFIDFEPENYAIDYWESMEAMRVEIAPSKSVAPQANGDLVVVTEEMKTDTINGGILLKETGPNSQSIQFSVQPNGPARDLKIKTGDKFTKALTGVVSYGFGSYKIYTDLADVKDALVEVEYAPQKSTIVNEEDKLTIASYNVENYSANKSAKETPDSKSKKIAESFVNVMNSPDIIGLIEVQDNNGQLEGPNGAEADESYNRLIKDIETAGGPKYEFVNIDPEYNQDGGAPNGNIRVGYLYNPARVSMVDAPKGSATEAVDYKDGKLTLNPGRIEPEHSSLVKSRKPLAAQFLFQGETVVVVANHLNSKLGDQGYYGQNQPPVLGSEPQRHEIAKLINDFVKDIKKVNPKENVVILGDMNDFEFSKSLTVLKGDELTNMIDLVPSSQRYTYVYQGNSQVLDHVLVSNNLVENTKVSIIHVNADFTEMHSRASDHDAVLVQMDLKEVVKPDIPLTPLEPSKPIDKDKIPMTPLEPSKPIDKDKIPTTPLEPSKPVVEGEKLPATGIEGNMKLFVVSTSFIALGLSAVYVERRKSKQK